MTSKGRDELGNAMSKTNANSFKYVISEDKMSILVMFADKESTSSNIVYQSILLDNDLEIINKSKFDYPNGQYLVDKTKLSNDGKLLMVGHDFAVKKSKKTNKEIKAAAFSGVSSMELLEIVLVPQDYFLTFHDAKDGGGNRTEKIVLAENRIDKLDIKFISNKAFVIYGLSKKRDEKFISSFFVNNGEIQDGSINFLFEENFKASSIHDYVEAVNKGVGSLIEIELRDFVVKDNGNMVLLCEKHICYISKHQDLRTGQVTINSNHYYGDIITTTIDVSGNMIDEELVKKSLYSLNTDIFSSFFTIVKENVVYVIYNELESNIVDIYNLDSSKEIKDAKTDVVIAIVELGHSGGKKQ